MRLTHGGYGEEGGDGYLSRTESHSMVALDAVSFTRTLANTVEEYRCYDRCAANGIYHRARATLPDEDGE